MTYDLALKLKEAGLIPNLSRNAEFYIAPDTIMLRKDIHKDMYDSLGNPVATNQFVYKPALEDLINHFGLDKVTRYLNGENLV